MCRESEDVSWKLDILDRELELDTLKQQVKVSFDRRAILSAREMPIDVNSEQADEFDKWLASFDDLEKYLWEELYKVFIIRYELVDFFEMVNVYVHNDLENESED